MSAMVAIQTDIAAPQRRPAPLDARPQLRLLQGGLSEPVVSFSVYRRRRVAALVLAVALVVGAAVGALAGLRVLAGSPGDGSLTVPAAANSAGAAPSVQPTSVSPGTASVVVAPGDTLWGIARQVTPAGGDVAGTVDRLVARNGGITTLQPGMRLQLD
jgi:hypothetical protein